MNTHLAVCLSPVVLYTESPAFFHLGANPRQQETADEVSQCSQTPFHPDKYKQNELCSPLRVCLGDRQIDMYAYVCLYVQFMLRFDFKH